MNTRFAIIAVLLVVPVGITAQEPGSKPDSSARQTNRVMVVSGTGEVSGVPDIAEINVGVVVEADTAKSAVEANNQQMNSLLAALKKLKIAEKDMQTSGFTVSPRYQQVRNTSGDSPKINGYRVSNQVHVRVRDIALLGQVLDNVVSAGANQINGISFAIDKSETLLDEARIKAVRDAKRKAGLLAREAGVALGPIIDIRENPGVESPMPYRTFAMAESRSVVPTQTGEQTLTAQIQITFSLQD